MKEIVLHLDGSHPIDCHIDGRDFPIAAFLLLTSVPRDPPTGHILAFGNSNIVGAMIFNFWRESVAKNPDGAYVIEQVARDIVKAADEARGSNPWPGEGGRAH